MIRNLALAVALALMLAVIGTLPRAPIAEGAPLANNCLDPKHDNAVSVWSWTANNNSSGRFSLQQSNTGDDTTGGKAVSNTMDVISIAGLLNKDFSGMVIGLGNNITIIANGAASDDFVLASAKRSGDATFKGAALGDVGFVRFNATLLACYDNLLSNTSFEVPSSDNTRPNTWNKAGANTANATWIRATGREDPPLDRLSGNSSLESKTTRSACPGSPSDGYWQSDAVNVTAGHEYMVGSFSHGLTSSSTAVIQMTDYILGIFEADFDAVTRTSTDWGLKTGVVNIPSGLINTVKISLKADVACVSPPVTGTVHFDDTFLIDVTGSTIRPQDSN